MPKTKKQLLFTAEQFTPTKWDTAEDKAWFANHFVRFVESDFAEHLFTQKFYKRLSLTFGHIANYDRNGFWHVFFTNLEGKVEFLRQTIGYPAYGSPEHTYCDVEKHLAAWVRTKQLLKKYEDLAIKAGYAGIQQDVADRLHPQAKQFKLVAISDNTNAFGLHQHIFVSADGKGWKVCLYRGVPDAPQQGQIVSVPLRRGEPDFGHLGYEIPEKLPDVPAEIVKKLWASEV